MNFRVSPQSRAVKLIFCLILLKFVVLIFFNENKIKLTSLAKCNVFPVAQNYDRKDWHDWKFIKYEETRSGPGEQGKAVVLTDPVEIELSKNLSKLEGLSPVVSDKISVNRSLEDGRLPV